MDTQRGGEMAKKKLAVIKIMELMSDYESRSSEQISDLTGVSHGTVRKLLVSELNYEKERRKVPTGGVVAFYSLKRHKIRPKECLN